MNLLLQIFDVIKMLICLDANDSVQADVDEPMPDADDLDHDTNLEVSAPMEEETMHDAGKVLENPSGEEEPMPEADDDDGDSDRNQEERGRFQYRQ